MNYRQMFFKWPMQTFSPIMVVVFYVTFSNFMIFLYEYLLQFIVMSLFENFGYKLIIKKTNYKMEFLIFYLFIGSGILIICLEDRLDHLCIVLFFSMIFVLIKQFMNYSVVDINNCQKNDVSIGAFWAYQAHEYYYKIVLESLNDRITRFERKHDVNFCIRKLILVAPVSCDISGTLDKKDDFIEYFGDLEADECDQAANMNRQYKNPVYKIHVTNGSSITSDKKHICNDGIYVVAEFLSPLGTLLKTKRSLEKEVWDYHRKCFIKTMKFLTKNTPCIIVDYDDNASEYLSSVLISAVITEGNRIPDIITI